MVGDEVVVQTLMGSVKGRIIEESAEKRLVKSVPKGSLLCQQELVDGQWVTVGTAIIPTERDCPWNHESDKR